MELIAPSFPLYVLVPVWAASLGLLLVRLTLLRDIYIVFLLLTMWSRYCIASFHEYTYPPIAGGFSIVALSSVVVILAGLTLIGGRLLLLQKLVPIYVMLMLVMISAAINESGIGAVNVSLKWLYLIVLTLVTYIALERRGPETVFRAVSSIFVAPIALQWLSVAWGLAAVNEDRTLSIIGGYQHGQAFSIIMLTFLYTSAFVPRLSFTSSYTRLLISAIGLAYANYRTALLASVLPIAAFALAIPTEKLVAKQRAVTFVFLGAVLIFALIGIAHVAENRFADLARVLDKSASLIQPPEYFTAAERQLFSGRLYLWSLYIDAYLHGDIINFLFGFGPESWVERFPLYAHNTFISHLYELGVLGLATFIWLLLANAILATSTVGTQKITLVSCHIGFIVLNLATMPFWTLEGDILYGLLLGYTWYMRSRASVAYDDVLGRASGVAEQRILVSSSLRH